MLVTTENIVLVLTIGCDTSSQVDILLILIVKCNARTTLDI